MTRNLIEKGKAVRAQVLGAEFERDRLQGVTDFSAPFHDLSLAFCWGSVWARDGVDLKTRSLLNIAFMIALNRPRELEVHMRGALRNGATPVEIREVLMQAAVYVGIPAAGDAFRIAHAVIGDAAKPASE